MSADHAAYDGTAREHQIADRLVSDAPCYVCLHPRHRHDGDGCTIGWYGPGPLLPGIGACECEGWRA